MPKNKQLKEFKVIITIRDERKTEPPCRSTVNSDEYYDQVERVMEYGRMKREYDCY